MVGPSYYVRANPRDSVEAVMEKISDKKGSSIDTSGICSTKTCCAKPRNSCGEAALDVCWQAARKYCNNVDFLCECCVNSGLINSLLAGGRTLLDYNITNGASIHLLQKAGGAGRSTRSSQRQFVMAAEVKQKFICTCTDRLDRQTDR